MLGSRYLSGVVMPSFLGTIQYAVVIPMHFLIDRLCCWLFPAVEIPVELFLVFLGQAVVPLRILGAP